MKVIGILSSPHGKGSMTRKLVEAGLKGAADAGATTEMVDVSKLDINFCLGCAVCHKKGKCAQQDDFPAIMDKVLDSDGIILSSPNYIDNVSAQMKTFMDRMVDAIHMQLLEGKYGFSVSTSGGGGEDVVIEYMNEFLIRCGAIAIGGAGARPGREPTSMAVGEKESYDMGKDLVAAIKEKRSYPEQEKIHGIFKQTFAYTLRANKDIWPNNYSYWVKKGWVQ